MIVIKLSFFNQYEKSRRWSVTLYCDCVRDSMLWMRAHGVIKDADALLLLCKLATMLTVKETQIVTDGQLFKF